MAKQVTRKTIKKTKKVVSPFNIYWRKNNFYLLFAGLLVIIAGFVFMSMGGWDSFPSLFISPVILVIGYLVILPASILFLGKKDSESNEGQEITAGKN